MSCEPGAPAVIDDLSGRYVADVPARPPQPRSGTVPKGRESGMPDESSWDEFFNPG